MPIARKRDPFKRVATMPADNDLDQVRVLVNPKAGEIVVESLIDGKVVYAETKSTADYDPRQIIDYAYGVGQEK